jgi:hypothetical protein
MTDAIAGLVDKHGRGVVTGRIVVELEPYRERRRVRRLAAGFLLGYLYGAYVLPHLVDELKELIDWMIDEPSQNGATADRVAAYTEPEE